MCVLSVVAVRFRYALGQYSHPEYSSFVVSKFYFVLAAIIGLSIRTGSASEMELLSIGVRLVVYGSLTVYVIMWLKFTAMLCVGFSNSVMFFGKLACYVIFDFYCCLRPQYRYILKK